LTNLPREGVVNPAIAGKGKHRYARFNAQGTGSVSGEQGGFRQIFGIRIDIHPAVSQKIDVLVQQDHVMAGDFAHPRGRPDYFENGSQRIRIVDGNAADHHVRGPGVKHQGREIIALTHSFPRRIQDDAPPPPHPVVFFHICFEQRTAVGIDDLNTAEIEIEPMDELTNALFRPQQDRAGDPLVHQDRAGSHNLLAVPAGEDHLEVLLPGLHDQAAQGLTLSPQAHDQALLIRLGLQRDAGHPFLDGLLRHRGRLAQQNAGINGLGQQVFRAKTEVLIAVGPFHLFDNLLPRQFGESAGGCNEHPFGDLGSLNIQGSPKDVRKAQGVQDRVGILPQTGCHDDVPAAGPGCFVADLGFRNGKGEDNGIRAHGAHHFLGH